MKHLPYEIWRSTPYTASVEDYDQPMDAVFEIRVKSISKNRIAITDRTNGIRFLSLHKKDNKELFNYLIAKIFKA